MKKVLTGKPKHLTPLQTGQIFVVNSLRDQRYETNDGVNPAENYCIEITSAGLCLFTLYFYNISL